MSTPVPPLHLPARSAQRGEVQVATIAGLLLAIFALYWPTLHSMAAIWWRSETFAHGFLVVPIFLFLVTLGTIAGLQIFTEPFVLFQGSTTLGGPESSQMCSCHILPTRNIIFRVDLNRGL